MSRLGNMSGEDYAFYSKQWPHLQDPRWDVFNDHRPFGSVWWHLKLPEQNIDGVPWGGRIGFHVGNNWSKFFLTLKVGRYPSVSFTQGLQANTETASTDEVLQEAERIIDEDLPGLAAEAQQKYDEWVKEVKHGES